MYSLFAARTSLFCICIICCGVRAAWEAVGRVRGGVWGWCRIYIRPQKTSTVINTMPMPPAILVQPVEDTFGVGRLVLGVFVGMGGGDVAGGWADDAIGNSPLIVVA